ncbi:Ras-like GTP-binding protein rhoA [Toxocara canis]|uniref:Ras-like GTP-binding protein rhoA n=1 Tax=Toxocara canis TaxID=6265 RepID=A0A0B2UYB8_TOXCA|nr:Ras-like GTP-binding protein rhoA [Toxocara canis]
MFRNRSVSFLSFCSFFPFCFEFSEFIVCPLPSAIGTPKRNPKRFRGRVWIQCEGTIPGKTSLLTVFSKDHFPDVYMPTVSENCVADIEVDGKQNLVQKVGADANHYDLCKDVKRLCITSSLGTFMPLCVVCGLAAGAGIGFSIAWFGSDGGSTHDHKERDKPQLESGTSAKDSYFPDTETIRSSHITSEVSIT